MTLYIHAGLPKTGSTSIQALMHDARAKLADLGMHYWDIYPNHTRPLRIMFRDPTLPNTEQEDVHEDKYGNGAAVRASLTEFLARKEGDLLISGEGITTFSTDNLRELQDMAGRDIKVIVYIRDPRSWYTSGAQQRIKTGSSFEQAVASRGDYRLRLEGLLEVFGDAVDLRLYKSSPDGKALIHDFMGAIGLEPTALDTHEMASSNESLSHNAIWFLEALNRRIQQGKVPASQGAVRHAAARLGGGSFKLPKETMEQLIESHKDDIEWLSKTMGMDMLAVGGEPKYGEPVIYPEDIVEMTLKLSQDLNQAVVKSKLATAKVFAAAGKDAEAKRLIRQAKALSPKNRKANAMERKVIGSVERPKRQSARGQALPDNDSVKAEGKERRKKGARETIAAE